MTNLNEKSLFDFQKKGTVHPVFLKNNLEINGKFSIETPDTMYKDNFRALRWKAYADLKSDAKKLKDLN